MSDKKKLMQENTKVRWAQLSGQITAPEAKRRLNEAKTTFPGNEVELEEGFEDGLDSDEELADIGAEDPNDVGDDLGGDIGAADLGGDDLGGGELGADEFGDDLGGDIGGGDEALAAQIITAISDAVSSVLGVATEVETDIEGGEFGDDLGGDEFGGDEFGGDMDVDMEDPELGAGGDDEYEEEIPMEEGCGKVDGSHPDHKLSDEKGHLSNSINENIDQISEAVVRKLAKYLRRK